MKCAKGFTLLELLMTVAILAILLAIAVPSFREFMLNSRRTTIVNELVASLSLARSEAQRNGQIVVVCPTADGASCGDNWALGWLVFMDLDDDGVVDAPDGVPPDETVFKSFRPEGNAHTIVSSLAQQTTPYRFRPFNAAATNGTLRICDSRGVSKARGVVINMSGRVEFTTKVAQCP
jgi:type IV fimbrial biogenesis protein FimT